MILAGGATYYGLSDLVEIIAWVEDDSGVDIYQQVESLLIELMHSDTVMMNVTATSEHYTKNFTEEKGSFRVFFMHPPIQNHQYVRLSVNLKNGDSAHTKISVLTEMMLAGLGRDLSNPAFGGRVPIAYPMPIEEEQA